MEGDNTVVTKADIKDLIDRVVENKGNPSKWLSMFTSRRFYLFLASVLVVMAAKFGIDISEEQMLGLVLAGSSLILGDSLRKVE